MLGKRGCVSEGAVLGGGEGLGGGSGGWGEAGSGCLEPCSHTSGGREVCGVTATARKSN